MENNKYYTPTIEEFHIGFEYETNYLKDDWVKKVLTSEDSGYFFETYKTDAVNVEFRVKLLDREDIESLGWTNGADTEEYVHYFRNSNMLLLNVDTRSITITDSIGGLKTVGESVPIKYLFHGEIKNKSELCRLMKQLKIE